MCINASKANVMSALLPGAQCLAVLLDCAPLEDIGKFGPIFVENGEGTENIRSLYQNKEI